MASHARDAGSSREAPVTPEPLLPDVAAGRPGAVAACVDRYGGLLWTVARRMLATSAEAEDAVQEIFLAMWQAAPRYTPARGSESVFVMTLARRRIIDRLRKAGRRPREVRLDDAPPAVDLALERGVEAARTVDALARLPEQRRDIVRLCVVEGWSHAEGAWKDNSAFVNLLSFCAQLFARSRLFG
ncbi:MAG: sigma-70 family RNA polymerase sigma factor, partial [Myxococcota bacterium]